MTDDIIAEREYQTEDGGTVLVRLLKPRPSERDWGCEVVFSGAFERRETAYGVDSLQALYQALKLASVELHLHEPAVFWFDLNDQLGLPITSAVDDLAGARNGEPL